MKTQTWNNSREIWELDMHENEFCFFSSPNITNYHYHIKAVSPLWYDTRIEIAPTFSKPTELQFEWFVFHLIMNDVNAKKKEKSSFVKNRTFSLICFMSIYILLNWNVEIIISSDDSIWKILGIVRALKIYFKEQPWNPGNVWIKSS